MLVFAASLLAAAVWPYYPFFRMALFDPAYHGELNTCSACFFQAVPWRVMPALIGVPVIILRMRANWRDPLGLMFIMLVAIYTLAAMFQQWTYGRVISYIVLTLQIALAAAVAQIESKLNFVSLSPSVQRGVYCLIIVLILFGFIRLVFSSYSATVGVRFTECSRWIRFPVKTYSTIRRSHFRLCNPIDHSNLRREACCI